MELRQIKVYDYDELSETAKENVRNYFIKNNDFYFLEDDLSELLKEKLQENKIKIIKGLRLGYSFGYSQGDGLNFIGIFEFKGFNFEIIKINHHYQHSKTTSINLIDYEENDDLSEIVLNEFTEIYYNICDELEKQGYNIIEYQNSEEAIKEIVQANEYKFLENGDLF